MFFNIFSFMNSCIFERITELLTAFDISQNRLAKSLNIEQRSVNRQLKGESSLSSAMIKGVADNFPTVSMEWLIRGNGEMLLNDAPATSSPQPVADDLPKEGEPVPNYDTTISVLVEAINNLNKVIAAQEQRIHELEAIVNDDDVQ